MEAEEPTPEVPTPEEATVKGTSREETAGPTESTVPAESERSVTPNFITDIIDRDLAEGLVKRVVTRFPPEPNGYLHIGHAKAICLDFGVANDYGGITYLRYDDTNPVTEDPEYVAAIERDVHWLGFQWHEVRHASDYFPQLYDFAVRLIEAGDAYVDSASEEEIRDYRGTVTESGRNSPFRDRTVSENLELFSRMRDGEFGPGEQVLRAKIDMGAANMKMRDPILYRVVDAAHYRTGRDWPIYPMYDFAHPLSDAIEGVTHSLCTLEFENNRDIYDWLLERLVGSPRPHQYEFARLQPDYTVVSKRRLVRLVHEGAVAGWDDPRMPTLSGLRRKGVTPEAIREFANRVGVAKANSRTDLALFDSAIRDDLNTTAPRVMAVLEPLRVTLTNVAPGEVTYLDAPYWPHDVPKDGSRRVPFTRELVIERSDFAIDPPRGFRRLAPGRSVRLRHGYVIRCDEVVTDEAGMVAELKCHAYLDSAGSSPEGVKVSAALHWVSATEGVPMVARLYQPLFTVPNPDGGGADFLEHLNPDALREVRGVIEPSVLTDDPDTRYQFERSGYFWRDPVDGRAEQLVFNRIVGLKDSWGKRAEATSGPTAVAAERAGSADPDGSDHETDSFDPSKLSSTERASYQRLLDDGLATTDAALLATRPELHDFYRATVAAGADRSVTANWVVNEVARELKENSKLALTPAHLASLLELLSAGTITHRVAKELFPALLDGADPHELVRERGLERLDDEAAVERVVAEVLTAHPEELAAYRAGKTNLKGFFMGQVMRATAGRAEPALVQRLLSAALDTAPGQP